MSVQTNTYAMIGASVPYDKVDAAYDRFEPYFDSAFDGIHHHDGICVLMDGMSGNYAFAGRVIAKSDEMGHLEMPVMFPSLHGEETADLKNKIEALFPGHPVELNAIVLTHYR